MITHFRKFFKQKFSDLAANSFMKIYYQTTKRKEPNRMGEMALKNRSQQPALLGLRDRRLRSPQSFPAGVVAVNLFHRLDTLHELETGIIGLEVRVGQYVLGGDEKILQRNLVVAEMDGITHRTESERLDFQSSRLRSQIERQRHSFPSFQGTKFSRFPCDRGYLLRFSITHKPNIITGKSQARSGQQTKNRNSQEFLQQMI